ncbi:hypothetical protein Dtox_1752 [Desulfofarcimen acetoxidans DSM 771]|uniref:Squalene cyclase C-terminal domain-containing protein n=1 Tax=Desulfofarcimen acetoxidans (strain ATCC 49208 / DSM 771 / KCTC 5769 / VKM B-1644 / 5575) TaxID=485916 RepID=C8VX33_DESAS|nr:prenyltransferase/squalene oxidase repeat-containing protein [Desulfofarcimen acetoxidans]ACV62609.1 hypothetical protein Dtox_1752 [Desulfofarcimen acetoxidans DSM 771]
MATQQDIKKAVSKGTAWLKEKQNPDGSFGSWDLGSTCLAVLALLHSRLDSMSPEIENAVAYIMNSSPPQSVHFRALTVMVLVAGKHKTPETLDRVQSDINWLIQAQCTDTGNNLSYGGWGPYGYDHTDGSNTQFALLALYAATFWSISVPYDTWQRTLSWYQNNHAVNKDGSFFYQTHEPTDLNNNQSTSCMTAAAFSGLKIINIFSKDEANKIQVKKLINNVQNWLENNYTYLYSNCSDDWHFYSLYSFKKGCVISPYTKLIGSHNWYDQISSHLLELQKTDGSWMSGEDRKVTKIKDTVFALLTLSKEYVDNSEEYTGENFKYTFMSNIACGIIRMNKHTICFRTK